MTREIEWVEFTGEDKTVVAIGHDARMSNDTLWFRIEFEKNGVQVKAEIPLSAYAVRGHLNKWFPPDTVRQDPDSSTVPNPGNATPGEPQK